MYTHFGRAVEQSATPLHRWVNLPPCLSNLSLCTFQSGTATPNVPVLAAFCDLAQDLPDLSSLQKVSIHMPVVSSSVGLPHPCQLIDLVREGMLKESLMNDAMQERLHTLSLSSTFSLHADNLLRTRAAFCNSIWFLFGRPSCHLWVPAQVTVCLVNVVGIALQALLTIRWLGPVLCWMQPPWADSSLLISRLLSSQVPTAVHR